MIYFLNLLIMILFNIVHNKKMLHYIIKYFLLNHITIYIIYIKYMKLFYIHCIFD